MALPDFSMKELLEAGVHFGHQTHRWNPKMKEFIYGEHNNIHIINLTLTMHMLRNAMMAVSEVTKSGGRILFVGTKRQASEIISDSASQCAQYYVNHRWLGGTLTNWKTISNTISRLKSIQTTLDEVESAGLTKKELLKLTRERDKLELSIGGIKNMGSLPDLIFVIDTVREQIAIKEAKKLNIPIAAIIDSNSDPDGITFPIPGNDDSTKSIKLYCDLISQAALDGISIQSKEDVKTQDNPKEGEEKSLSKSDIVGEKQKRDTKDQKNTAEVAESETKDDAEDSKDKNQEKSLDKDKKD
ncbi:MAG: 30S ribosomal protein S2 [Alphaproteobacteria bacterium]